MSLIESISKYFDSIVFLWSGYLISMFWFYIYNYKYRFIYGGRKSGISVKIIGFLNRTICILPVVIPVAIRGISVGADTYNYWQSFQRSLDYSFIEAISYDATALLYNILKWLVVRLANGNVQVFFFIFSYFTMYLVVRTIEVWKLKHGCMALFFFYCCFGPNMMDQMRQMLAVAILLYAYQYAYNKETKKYFIYAIIAGMFHFSALLSAIIIWILQKQKKNEFKEYMYYTVLVVVILFMQHFLSVLGIFLDDTKYGSLYLGSFEQTTSIGFGLLLSIMPNLIPILWLQKKLDRENRFRNTILMVFPIRLVGYYSYFVHRVMYYFSVQSIIALPLAFEKVKKNRAVIRVTLCVLNIVYFIVYYVVAQGEGYFPYVTCFER